MKKWMCILMMAGFVITLCACQKVAEKSEDNYFGTQFSELSKKEREEVTTYADMAIEQLQEDWSEHCEGDDYEGTGYMEVLHTIVYLIDDELSEASDSYFEDISAIVEFNTLEDYLGVSKKNPYIINSGMVGNYIVHEDGTIENNKVNYMKRIYATTYTTPINKEITVVNLKDKYNMVYEAK